METSVLAILISLGALALGVVNALISSRQRSRQQDSAVTGDLYPVLRNLRDAGWQYAKPLGGQSLDDLVILHYALIDLLDLRPAIQEEELRQRVDELLEHDAASLALSIDPPRLVTVGFPEDTLAGFHDFAERAQMAVERCQSLRRGAT